MEKNNRKILVLAITRIGDLLQASPTFAGMKEEDPDCEITVLVEKQTEAICRGIPNIDHVHVLDLSMLVRSVHRGGEGIVEGYEYVDNMIEELRSKGYDMILNMSSSPYTALMMKMIDAPKKRGWLADDEGYRLITDHWAMLIAAFVFHSNRDFNSINLVDIIRCSAEVKKHPLKLEFVTKQNEKEFAEEFFTKNNIVNDGPILALQAGASQEKRQWSPKLFAKLTKILVEELNARIIFTGSPSEAPIVEQILQHYQSPRIVSAVGKTNLGQLAAILEKADLLITGDTGPMHLSVAVGKPVVAVFLASALCFETGPYSKGNFVIQPIIECSPCNPNFSCYKTDCHDHVTPEMIAFLTKLRLQTVMGEESKIELPQQLKNYKKATIYYTDFDEEGFLKFIPLNDEPNKNGQAKEFYHTARAAYRSLWKEDFSGLPFNTISNSSEVTKIHPWISGVKDALNLSNEALNYLKLLESAVWDKTVGAKELSIINQQIHDVERRIEEVGLTNPVLGAMIRIFLMEKENIRGNDIVELASETRVVYQKLINRAVRFNHMFNFYLEDKGIYASTN
ncbi:MAG: glycosyltransferase family 9 protein [Proteobacteria bacterium]|nr:glycosyltransferase family 9 protein [Pseudomonadota bacterium]